MDNEKDKAEHLANDGEELTGDGTGTPLPEFSDQPRDIHELADSLNGLDKALQEFPRTVREFVSPDGEAGQPGTITVTVEGDDSITAAEVLEAMKAAESEPAPKDTRPVIGSKAEGKHLPRQVCSECGRAIAVTSRGFWPHQRTVWKRLRWWHLKKRPVSERCPGLPFRVSDNIVDLFEQLGTDSGVETVPVLDEHGKGDL